jgi:hypothetical protein
MSLARNDVQRLEREIKNKYERVGHAVNSINKLPTIVNEDSKFVVITYWWGRGNLNRNTARPCIGLYEEILNEAVNFIIHTPPEIPIKMFPRMLMSPGHINAFNKHVDEYIRGYNKYLSSNGAVSAEYVPKTHDELKSLLLKKLFKTLDQSKTQLNEMRNIYFESRKLEEEYHKRLNAGLGKKEYVASIRDRLKEFANDFNKNTQQIRSFFASVKTELDRELVYLPPIKFETMIANWEAACEKAGCNYLAVDISESFPNRQDYQLAINAKPRFIRRALELCDGRAVVYIDGDMVIKKYPHIFDMDDIDLMARGWNIDPRGNSKYKRSIFIDPYVFETSGGIMYFSKTPESQLLLNKWIQESETVKQYGKADDRILSLVFNTYRLLLPLKIIQLPIEYLWLTLAYDNWVDVTDEEYEQIYVTHPECLTTEDTAAKSGASSDRTPKYYSAVETLYPRSEDLMEQVMFDSPEQAEAFTPYINYLENAVYFENDDPDLEGENAFNIVRFENGFGKKYNPVVEENIRTAASIQVGGGIVFSQSGLPNNRSNYSSNNESNNRSVNEFNKNYVASNYNASSTNFSSRGSPNSTKTSQMPVFQDNMAIINEHAHPNMIAFIIKMLQSGISVKYIPTTSSQKYIANLDKMIVKYPRIEFAFKNKHKSYSASFVFQSEIDVTEPIYFKAGCKHLVQLLSLCKTFAEPAQVFNNAGKIIRNKMYSLETVYKNSYQFLSRIRTYYLIPEGVKIHLKLKEEEEKPSFNYETLSNDNNSEWLSRIQLGGEESVEDPAVDCARAYNFLYNTTNGGRRLKTRRAKLRNRTKQRRNTRRYIRASLV